MLKERLTRKAAKHLTGFAQAMAQAAANPEVKSPLLNDGTRRQVIAAASQLQAMGLSQGTNADEGEKQ